MKRKKKSGKSGTGANLAKILTASLVMNPVFYVLPPKTPYVQAATPLASTLPFKAPYLKSPLPDMTTSAGQSLTLDLSQYFEGAAEYELVNNQGDYSGSVSGNLLTLYRSGAGTARVEITGKADGTAVSTALNTVTDTFNVAFVSIMPDVIDKDHNNKIDIAEIAAFAGSNTLERTTLNQSLQFVSPQAVTAIPNTPPRSKLTPLSVNKNQSINLTADLLFDDPDYDSLTIDTFSLNNITGIAMASLTTNNWVTLTGVQQGLVNLNVSVYDGHGGKASNTYQISVTDSTGGTNTPPIVNPAQPLSDVTVTRNTYKTISLADGFFDADGDTLQFNPVQVSTSNVIDIEQNQGELKIYGAAAGTTTVTASVYDGRGGTASDSFTVTVGNAAPDNHAPVAGTIPPQTTTAGNAITISPASYFTDPDEGDTLSFSIASSTPGIVSAVFSSISTNSLKISPIGVGTTTLTLTATDNHGGASSISFNVTVENSAPQYVNGYFTDQYLDPNDSVPVTIDLTAAFTDADISDTLSFTAISNNTSLATVTVSGNQLMIYPASTGHGQTTVGVTADDGHSGGIATTSFNVTVNNVPRLIGDPIPTININAGQSASFVVSDRIVDDDGDSLVYSATSDLGGSVSVTLLTSADTYANIHGLPRGTNTVTLNAVDQYGGSVSDTFIVNVLNNAPVLKSTPPTKYVPTSDSITVSASEIFDDVDGDNLEFTDVNFNSFYIGASLDSGELILSGLSPGISTVDVTVSDGPFGGTTTGSFLVEVNAPPTGSIPFTHRILAAEWNPIELCLPSYFNDQDELIFNVESDNNEVIDVVTGEGEGSFELYGLTSGTATITITVDDRHGNIITDIFTIEVYDPDEYFVYDAPNTNATIEINLFEIFGELPTVNSISVSGLDDNIYLSSSYGFNADYQKLNMYRNQEGELQLGTTTITVTVTDPSDGPSKYVKFNFYNDPGF